MQTRAYDYWVSHVWPSDKLMGLRKGQSFVNFFMMRNEPALFYSTDEYRTDQIIRDYCERYQL